MTLSELINGLIVVGAFAAAVALMIGQIQKASKEKKEVMQLASINRFLDFFGLVLLVAIRKDTSQEGQSISFHLMTLRTYHRRFGKK